MSKEPTRAELLAQKAKLENDLAAQDMRINLVNQKANEANNEINRLDKENSNLKVENKKLTGICRKLAAVVTSLLGPESTGLGSLLLPALMVGAMPYLMSIMRSV